MTDLSNHAIVPLEHLIELESCAYNAPPLTVTQHTASAVKNTLFFAAAAVAVAAGTYGWALGVDFLEERRLKRSMLEREALQNFTRS